MKLLIATKNRNKVREIQNKFSGIKGIELLSLTDIDDAPDVEEDPTAWRNQEVGAVARTGVTITTREGPMRRVAAP